MQMLITNRLDNHEPTRVAGAAPVPPRVARLRASARCLALRPRTSSPHTPAHSACRAPAVHPASCPGSPTAMSWPCVRAGMAVSWYASRHAAQPQAPLPVAIHCIVLQCNSNQTILLQYNILYCNTVYSLPT